jgi:hypothetical protein
MAILGSHLGLGLTMWSPIPFMVLLGLGYAIYGVVLWPCIAMVVQQYEITSAGNGKLLGTSFGISTCALNLSLTLIPIVSAQIRNSGGSFLPVEIFYASLAGIGGILVGVLYWIPSLQVLQKPSRPLDVDPLSDATIASEGSPNTSDVDEIWPDSSQVLFKINDDQISCQESFFSQKSLGPELSILGPSKFMSRKANSTSFSPLVEDSEDEISIE